MGATAWSTLAGLTSENKLTSNVNTWFDKNNKALLNDRALALLDGVVLTAARLEDHYSSRYINEVLLNPTESHLAQQNLSGVTVQPWKPQEIVQPIEIEIGRNAFAPNITLTARITSNVWAQLHGMTDPKIMLEAAKGVGTEMAYQLSHARIIQLEKCARTSSTIVQHGAVVTVQDGVRTPTRLNPDQTMAEAGTLMYSNPLMRGGTVVGMTAVDDEKDPTKLFEKIVSTIRYLERKNAYTQRKWKDSAVLYVKPFVIDVLLKHDKIVNQLFNTGDAPAQFKGLMVPHIGGIPLISDIHMFVNPELVGVSDPKVNPLVYPEYNGNTFVIQKEAARCFMLLIWDVALTGPKRLDLTSRQVAEGMTQTNNVIWTALKGVSPYKPQSVAGFYRADQPLQTLIDKHNADE